MTPPFRLLLALAGLASSACSLHEMGEVLSPSVTGHLVLEAPGGEVRELRPDRCVSGDHFHFLGADLADGRGATIRAVLDPLRGPGVRVSLTPNPDDVPLVLDVQSCPGLRLDVSDSGWRVNEFRAVVGELELDCTTPGGGRVHGRLAFRQCS